MNSKLFWKKPQTLRENKASCESRSYLAHNCDQKNEKNWSCQKAMFPPYFKMTCHFRIYLNLKGIKQKLKISSITQTWKQGDYRYFVFVLLTLSPLSKFSLRMSQNNIFTTFSMSLPSPSAHFHLKTSFGAVIWFFPQSQILLSTEYYICNSLVSPSQRQRVASEVKETRNIQRKINRNEMIGKWLILPSFVESCVDRKIVL